MKWQKIQIDTTSAGTDALTGLLLNFGIAGVEIIDPKEFTVFLEQDKSAWDYVDETLVKIPDGDHASVVFYLADDDVGAATLREIEAAIAQFSLPHIHLGTLKIHTLKVDDADWLDEWKKHFAPIRAGKVLILPAWEVEIPIQNPPPEITFTLDPSSAFGTGQHATTFLCVEALQAKLKRGQSLLDAGCGSGILSLIGLLLGAGEVFACDIDPAAITATLKNAELNPIDITRLRVMHGNILTDSTIRSALNGRKFDIITANIVADVVIALLPEIPALLTSGGFFIASGIIDDRVGDVLAALARLNFTVISNEKLDGWHCLVCHG